MGPSEIVESYIGDVVRLLPGNLRTDVAKELSSLLAEELASKASVLGKQPDAAMALELVRAQGQPNEVAARYQAPWAIIDPADSTSFLRAAVIGFFILCTIWGISNRSQVPLEERGFKIQVGILSWLGALAVYFSLKAWFRRRWPGRGIWIPSDRDAVSRLGVALAFPFAALCIVFYAEPAWFLDALSGSNRISGSVAYTTEFKESRLPCLVGLQAALLVLLTHAAWVGKWRKFTRRLNIFLNLVLAILVLVIAADGGVFQVEKVDRIAGGIFGLVGLIYLPLVGVMIHQEMGRVDPVTLPKGNDKPGAKAGSPSRPVRLH